MSGGLKVPKIIFEFAKCLGKCIVNQFGTTTIVGFLEVSSGLLLYDGGSMAWCVYKYIH